MHANELADCASSYVHLVPSTGGSGKADNMFFLFKKVVALNMLHDSLIQFKLLSQAFWLWIYSWRL